jgi:hypothetical protein
MSSVDEGKLNLSLKENVKICKWIQIVNVNNIINLILVFKFKNKKYYLD